MSILQRIIKDRVHVGLLLLRVFSGYLIVVNHGFRKITGGPERWEKLGNAMEIFGIDFSPTFWGFMAAFSECIGGLMIILGFHIRYFSLLLKICFFLDLLQLIFLDL